MRAIRLASPNAIPGDYAVAWHKTIVDYSFNPFRSIDVTPPATDLTFTEHVMNAVPQGTLHARCALLDEALAKFTPPPSPQPSRTPSTAQSYYAMWNYMESLGGEITFQTPRRRTCSRLGVRMRADGAPPFALAHQFGASSVELFVAER